MKKYNRKFNNACACFTFWNALENHFNGFDNLLKSNDKLTSEDRLVLFEIHTLLFKCYQLAKSRRNIHSSKITALIGH